LQFLEAKINHDRWAEECEMARAELHLTRESFWHHRRYWNDRALAAVMDGAAAHAHYMAAMYHGMAEDITLKIDSIV